MRKYVALEFPITRNKGRSLTRTIIRCISEDNKPRTTSISRMCNCGTEVKKKKINKNRAPPSSKKIIPPSLTNLCRVSMSVIGIVVGNRSASLSSYELSCVSTIRERRDAAANVRWPFVTLGYRDACASKWLHKLTGGTPAAREDARIPSIQLST